MFIAVFRIGITKRKKIRIPKTKAYTHKKKRKEKNEERKDIHNIFHNFLDKNKDELCILSSTTDESTKL